MIRMFLIFVLLFIFFFFGIKSVKQLSTPDKINLTKVALYSILCSILSTAVLVSIVLLF